LIQLKKINLQPFCKRNNQPLPILIKEGCRGYDTIRVGNSITASPSAKENLKSKISREGNTKSALRIGHLRK